MITRVDSGGVGLSVQVEGEGTPVVLIHGFPDTRALWRNQVPVLVQAGFRVIAPDLRGMGESDKPEDVEAYGLMHHLADIAAIMDSLEVPRARIVGHDWGAAISWMLATFDPARVERLVALSVGRPGTRERTPRDLRRLWYMFMFQFDEVEDYLTRNDWAHFRAWATTAPDVEEYIDRLGKPGALRAGINIYRANANPAVLLGQPYELPTIATDTLGVWSTLDFALSEEQMTDSEADVAGSWRYERIEDAGHWIPTEAPDRLNELLLDFLA